MLKKNNICNIYTGGQAKSKAVVLVCSHLQSVFMILQTQHSILTFHYVTGLFKPEVCVSPSTWFVSVQMKILTMHYAARCYHFAYNTVLSTGTCWINMPARI